MKKTIKYFTVVLVLIMTLSCVTTGTRSVGSAEMEAEKLFETMKMDESISQTIEQSLDMQLIQNPSLVPFKDVMLDFMNKYMSYDSLKEDLVRIYTETFTAEEIADMNDFYKTKTGQKCISTLPELTVKGSELGYMRVQNNMAELEQLLMEEAKRLGLE